MILKDKHFKVTLVNHCFKVNFNYLITEFQYKYYCCDTIILQQTSLIEFCIQVAKHGNVLQK